MFELKTASAVAMYARTKEVSEFRQLVNWNAREPERGGGETENSKFVCDEPPERESLREHCCKTPDIRGCALRVEKWEGAKTMNFETLFAGSKLRTLHKLEHDDKYGMHNAVVTDNDWIANACS